MSVTGLKVCDNDIARSKAGIRGIPSIEGFEKLCCDLFGSHRAPHCRSCAEHYEGVVGGGLKERRGDGIKWSGAGLKCS